MNECKRCKERGQTWQGDAPKCAFPESVFTPENWNCATLNALRDKMQEDDITYSEDQKVGVLPYDGMFLVLGWYKSRGRVEFAGVIMGQKLESLTLGAAELFLKN